MKRTLLFLALAATLAGCLVVKGPHGGKAILTPVGIVVVPPAGHVHTPACGHYFHGGKWYEHRGHHHAGGCGHLFKGGIWVLGD